MSEAKYALFLGCTVPVRGFNYELSARRVADKVGLELVDCAEFACCGFPVEAVHHQTSLALAARNLAIAEQEGKDIITLCSACTGHMTKTMKHLTSPEGKEELDKVNEGLDKIGKEFKGNVKVKHFARALLEDVGLEKIQGLIEKPLDALAIAPHYGCHYIKPSDIFDGFDDPIYPKSLDDLIEVTGATSVQYKDKLQCCGGGILAVNEEAPTKMVANKLGHIKAAGADAMTLLCPFCDIMFDEFQPTIEEKFSAEYNIPVLYYPQLLGLGLGLDPKKDLAVNKNQVKVKPLLAKLGDNGGE